jgi:transposase
MHTGQTVFSQLIDFLPEYQFRKCVEKYQGNYGSKGFSCWDHFLCMSFAQLTYRESLRDIEACLRSLKSKLYHNGIHCKVSRSTIAYANENRDWRIYADFAHILIDEVKKLYANDKFGVELDETVYALDSTTIDLCLSLFPWAKFRKHKGAIKLHTLMDLRGSIPSFIRITSGKVHDVNILDELIPETGSFYVMDRGYTDFARLYRFTQCLAFFIIRAKKNLDFHTVTSHTNDKSPGLRCDQAIALNGVKTSNSYPEKLRRVKYYDAETNKTLVFLTNNFSLHALTVAELYRCRWKIELFFKWIKQHLRIKAFYGSSENAVKTQIWIAVSTYLLVAMVKKMLKLELSLYTILQILSISVFEKIPILQLLTNNDFTEQLYDNPNQLNLFDF